MDEQEDARKGVRISIYLPASLVTTIDEEAWKARKSRSRYLSDVITKATQPKASRVRQDPAVSGL